MCEFRLGLGFLHKFRAEVSKSFTMATKMGNSFSMATKVGNSFAMATKVSNSFSMAMMMKQPWMCRIEAPVQLRQLRRSSKENDCEENVSDEDEQSICETLFSELLSM